MESLLYYSLRTLLKIMLLLTRYRVRGKENIPRSGGLLVVANHLGVADPPLVGYSLGRSVTFMAKQELFRSRLVGYFLRNLGAYPVRRGRLDREALRWTDQVLTQGKALVMFPEGRRSQNAKLQSAFSGAALIAFRSGMPILPIGISGTERLDGIAWIWHRPPLTVNIGHPFSPRPTGSRLTKAELAELTDTIMRNIAELLPPEYRGDYHSQGKSDDIES